MLLFIFDCDHVTTMLPVHDMSCVACMNSCARQFDCVCFVLCTHVTAARAFSNNFEAFKDHGILTEHGIELCAVMLSCRPGAVDAAMMPAELVKLHWFCGLLHLAEQCFGSTEQNC